MPSKSNKNKLSLPTYPPPAETVCIPVNVPNDDRWIALFLGAIYRLTQQIWYDRDEAHTAKLVAAIWSDIYLETVKAAWDCEGSVFDLRVSPTDECLIEKTTDGVTWVEAFRLDTDCALTRIIRNPATGEYGWEVEDVGFYKFPDGPYVAPTAVQYPTNIPAVGISDTQRRCNVAYAGAIALQGLYRATWDAFTQRATKGAIWVAAQLMDYADEILRGLAGIDIFAEIAELLYEESAAFTEGGFPDTYLERATELLYCRSSVTDGVVSFDFANVVNDFGSEHVADPGGPFGALNFLLQLYLGEAGLNSVAGMKVTSPFECDFECDFAEWEALSGSGRGGFEAIANPWSGNCIGTYNLALDRFESCKQFISNEWRVGVRIKKQFADVTVSSVTVQWEGLSFISGVGGMTLITRNNGSQVSSNRVGQHTGTYTRNFSPAATIDEIEIVAEGYMFGAGSDQTFYRILRVEAVGSGPPPF